MDDELIQTCWTDNAPQDPPRVHLMSFMWGMTPGLPLLLCFRALLSMQRGAQKQEPVNENPFSLVEHGLVHEIRADRTVHYHRVGISCMHNGVGSVYWQPIVKWIVEIVIQVFDTYTYLHQLSWGIFTVIEGDQSVANHWQWVALDWENSL